VVWQDIFFSMEKTLPTKPFSMQEKTNDKSIYREAIIPEGYYSEKEMAEFLGKTIPTLRVDHCHRRNRVPPKTKMGRVIIYSKLSFSKWLESREVKNYDFHRKSFRKER
jgi:hypothetical protein